MNHLFSDASVFAGNISPGPVYPLRNQNLFNTMITYLNFSFMPAPAHCPLIFQYIAPAKDNKKPGIISNQKFVFLNEI